MRAEGGARARLGLFDSELKVACSFTPTKEMDGEREVLRCMPDQLEYQSAFVDSGCKEQAIALDARCAQPSATSYIAKGTIVDSCTSTAQYFEVGAQVTGGAPGFELDYAMKCGTRSATQSETLYRLGPALDLTRYVRGFRIAEKLPKSGLERTLIEADDGTRYFQLATVDGDSCSVQRQGDRRFCVPNWVGATDYAWYQGAQCTGDRVYGVGFNDCYGKLIANAIALFNDDASADNCGELKALYRPGKALTEAWSNPGTTCQKFMPSSSQRIYTLGEAIDLSRYASLTQRSVGQGRLRKLEIVTEEGAFVQSDGWLDTELDLRCGEYRASDGKLRCFPGISTAGEQFADPACTDTLELAYPSFRCPGGGPAYFMRTVTTMNGCRPSSVVQSVVKDEPYAGAVYRKAASGACTMITPSAAETGRFYKSTETLPLARFQEVSQDESAD